MAEEAPLGMRYVRGKFIVKPELVEEDREIPGDQRTAELVTKVANSIYTFVRVEPDYPASSCLLLLHGPKPLSLFSILNNVKCFPILYQCDQDPRG